MVINLEEIDKVASSPKWISVEEFLPPYNLHVLIRLEEFDEDDFSLYACLCGCGCEKWILMDCNSLQKVNGEEEFTEIKGKVTKWLYEGVHSS